MAASSLRWKLVVALGLSVSSCVQPQAVDAGHLDSGNETLDAGTPDSGTDAGDALDAGVADAGVDAGLIDGGAPDAGPPDAGPRTTRRFLEIAAGARHTCALGEEISALDSLPIPDSEGVYCWGANDKGQLGVADSGPGPVLVPIAGVVTVRAGGDVTCVRTKRAIGVFCFGDGSLGQLGDGLTVTRPGVIFQSLDSGVMDFDVGESHVCGATRIRQMDPLAMPQKFDVICWGRNRHGAFGDIDAGQAPTAATHWTFTAPTFVPPNASLDLRAFDDATCLTAGFTTCWGKNEGARFGRDAGSVVAPGILVDARGWRVWGDRGCFPDEFNEALACVGTSATSTLTPDGGSFADLDSPALISMDTSPPAAGGPLPQFVVGPDLTCSELDLRGGWGCWGTNGDGALGSSDVDARFVYPVPGLPPGRKFLGHASKGRHVCVIVDGGVYCWGSNSDGQANPSAPGTNVFSATRVEF